MYIVEFIDPEKAKSAYRPEVFNSINDAEFYLEEVCEGRDDLEGIVLSISLEKNINNRMVLTSAHVVYHT